MGECKLGVGKPSKEGKNLMQLQGLKDQDFISEGEVINGNLRLCLKY